jgi:signal transduction histidine kinase/ActR/RegA family two-component response regulator/HPt (histidine-containing phosphotransfer) domain-containing protein
MVGCAVLLYVSYQSARAEREVDTLRTARALVAAVDLTLARAEAIAYGLATSRALDEHNFTEFQRRSTEMLSLTGVGTNVVLSDRDGRQLVNTLRPLGEALPRHGNPAQLRRVFETGSTVVSDVYLGGVAQRPVVSVDVPAARGGQVVFDVSIGLFPDDFRAILDAQKLPPGWVAAVLDSQGVIVARTVQQDRFVGQKGSPTLLAHLLDASEGAAWTATLEGMPVYSAWSRSGITRWSVAIGIPRGALLGGLERDYLLLGALVALLLLGGMAYAWTLGAKITGSVRALEAPAMALGRGEPVMIPPLALPEAQDVGRSLTRAAALLAQRTEERDRAMQDLSVAKLHAEKADRAKSAFLTTMSHEIRTPLHNVVMLASMLCDESVDSRQRARLEDLRASAEHLMQLINDVLDLSLIETERFVLDQAEFALRDVLDAALATVSGPAVAKGLDLSLDDAAVPADVVLRGDALRLRQVLINLLGNAVKFTGQGAVTLRVEPLESDPSELRLRFRVQDTGPGMDRADCARLFDALEASVPAPLRSSGGSGLGLAISARLVRAMGGAIEGESMPGEGTIVTFELTFPRGVAAPDSTPEPIPPGSMFVGSRVLVAEDNPLSRELMRQMLTARGCMVDLAEDGVAAVERARSTPYDLILMDLQMPRMDGLGATRAIRALPEHAHTPILGVTSSAFADDRRRCLEAGMTEHVGKPVTPEILARVLARWLAPSFEDEAPPPFDAGGTGGDGCAGPGAGGASGADPGSARRAMLAGDPVGVLHRADVVAEYARLHRDDMRQLDELLRAGHVAEARRRVHALEGASAMVGANRVRIAATRLSEALHAGAADPAVAALAATCAAEIASFVSAARDRPGPPA